MQLGLLLALVAAIIMSEHAPPGPVEAATLRCALVAAASLAVVLLARLGSSAIARAMDDDRERRATWLCWFARLRQAHLLVWLCAIGIIFFALGWPQLVRFNWQLDRIVLVKDLVILAPIWLPLLFSWAAFYEVEVAVYRAAPHQEVSDESTAASRIASRSQYVWLHARHYLGLCILPILALLCFQDVLCLVAPAWEQSDGAWLVCLVPLVALMIAFPHILSRIWSTSTLPDSPLRAQLTALTNRMGVRCRDFKIWQTDRQVFNAAVAGLLPSLRYIFMTDALLMYLRDDELEAVVAHELGHVRRRHLLLRVLLLGLPLWIAANFQAFSPELADATHAWRSGFTGVPGVTSQLVTGCLAFGVAVLALGRYSRLLEHDADLCVLDAGRAETFMATIDRLSYLCGDQRQRSTWLHPSTVARIHLLQCALEDPRVAPAFRRRVSLINRLLFVAWIVAPVAATLI